MHSEYPFIIKDDVVELVDEYDNTIERSFRKEDLKGDEHMSFEMAQKAGDGDPMARLMLGKQ